MNNKLSFRAGMMMVEDDEEKKGKRIRVSVSSDAPVLSWVHLNGEYQRAYEILDHSEKSVNMARAKDGLVIQDGHGGDQIGLMRVELKDGKLGGVIEFCAGERAQNIAADAAKGLRRNMSVGYQIDPSSYRVEGTQDGIPLVRAMSWTPYEASFVNVPADVTVGVGRSDAAVVSGEADTSANTRETAKIEVKERTEMDSKEVAVVMARAAKCGMIDDVGKMIEAGKGRAEIETAMADKMAADLAKERAMPRTPEAAPISGPVTIGLTEKEKRRYSMMNVLRSLAGERVDIGFERECSDAVAKAMNKSARGVFMPFDISVRDLQIGGGGTGANVVSTNLMAADFITALRAKLALNALGVTTMSGLVGDIAIPVGPAVTGYWVAESTAPTESTPVLSQKTGSPNAVGATVDISRKLLLQSSIDVEAYVRNEIAVALANAIDAAAFNGAGGDEPTGLLTGPISTDVSMTAGSVTYANICSILSTLEGKNVNLDSVKFACPSAVFWDLAAEATSTNGPIFVADYNTGRIVGRPSVVSSNVTAKYLFAADWSKMILAMWGNGLDLVVDPYTNSKTGILAITGFMDADIIVKDAAAFAHADTLA